MSEPLTVRFQATVCGKTASNVFVVNGGEE